MQAILEARAARQASRAHVPSPAPAPAPASAPAAAPADVRRAKIQKELAKLAFDHPGPVLRQNFVEDVKGSGEAYAPVICAGKPAARNKRKEPFGSSPDREQRRSIKAAKVSAEREGDERGREGQRESEGDRAGADKSLRSVSMLPDRFSMLTFRLQERIATAQPRTPATEEKKLASKENVHHESASSLERCEEPAAPLSAPVIPHVAHVQMTNIVSTRETNIVSTREPAAADVELLPNAQCPERREPAMVLPAMKCPSASNDDLKVVKKAPGLMELLEASVELEADSAHISALDKERGPGVSNVTSRKQTVQTSADMDMALASPRYPMHPGRGSAPFKTADQSSGFSGGAASATRAPVAESVVKAAGCDHNPGVKPAAAAGTLATPAGLKMAMGEGRVGDRSVDWMVLPELDATSDAQGSFPTEGVARRGAIRSPEGVRRLQFTAISSL